MNRRKYLLSTLGLGTGLGIASHYNTNPVIASDINLTDEAINISEDITEQENPQLQIDFETFKINEINYYGANPQYTIEAQTVYNSSESGFETIGENLGLDENNNVQDITDDSHFISLELPNSLEEDNSFTIQIEFKFITTDNNIGPFTKTENIFFNVGDNWSEPNEEPGNLSTNDLEGEGTEENPYIIMNDQELQAIDSDLNANYELGQNIDASGTEKWNDGAGFTPIGGEFDGLIDGNEYSIKNLYINRPEGRDIGLVSVFDSTGRIKNINIINADITGERNVGIVLGENDNGTPLKNVHITGHVEGQVNVGGMVGFNNTGGRIEDSSSDCIVHGESNVGGLSGRNQSSITNSYSNGEVHGESNVGGIAGNCDDTIESSHSNCRVDGNEHVGGLVGDSNDGVIQNSYSTGKITGDKIVGGLAGRNRNSTTRNSYATGNVKGDESVGGLIGYNDEFRGGTIENSYSIGDVEGDESVGGLVGNNTGDIEESYWDKEKSTVVKNGDVLQEQPIGNGDGDVSNLNTEEMQGSSAEIEMNKFDFDDVWETVEGDYPVLQSIDTQVQLDNR